MKRTPKPVFFIVATLILVISFTALFGVTTNYGDRVDTVIRGADGIRTGIDISGGVEATFAPADESIDASDAQIDAMKEVIVLRMIGKNITDHEAYADYDNDQVIIRFPWAAGETKFNAKETISELGQLGELRFYYDEEESSGGLPTTPPTKDKLILSGDMLESAAAGWSEGTTTMEPVVNLKFTDEGAKKFADATKKQFSLNGSSSGKYTISIWLVTNKTDEELAAEKENSTTDKTETTDKTDKTENEDHLKFQCLSNPGVKAHITNGEAQISGAFAEYSHAAELANLINAGSLPFSIEAKNYNTVTATMGENALQLMVLAGIVAFALIAIFMLVYYRLSGFVAVIALIGQVAGSVAAVSGYFAAIDSFTLTLPGIAGIILSIGMGVDANIITAERIKEQIRAGRTIDSAVQNGCKESFSAIFDGNITVLIVSVVLMGVFGPADSFFAKLLKPFLFMFPVSTSGAVYSFGYTLLIGIIFNFIMGVTCSRLMMKSVTRLKFLRKPWLLGGKRHD